MAIEQETNTNNKESLKEFKNLLDQDFKDRQVKENVIIAGVVTEITKNFVVVDCKLKMEGMIPIEEFKNDNELDKHKIGSEIDVYLERIESFKGEYNYKPPIFSAIKINGIPSYKLARDGKCVELAIKKSYIEEIKIINSGFSTLNLRIESSKGTYIRALARDIGLALGSFGTVSKLRRTKTGKFDIKTSNNFFALINGSEPLFFPIDKSVSYTHLTLPTKRIV